MPEKKKSMQRKPKGRPASKSVLLQIYENKLARDKVAEALTDKEVHLDQIADMLAGYGIKASVSAISRYSIKLREAEATGVPVVTLLDKRQKTSRVLQHIKAKEVNNPLEETSQENSDNSNHMKTVKKMGGPLTSDMEFIEAYLQKAWKGLNSATYLDPSPQNINLAIKMMETKAKLSNNQMRGLTLRGLDEIKLRMTAHDHAITSALLKYVPQKQHQEVLDYIDEQEKEFLKNLDVQTSDKATEELWEDLVK